MLFDVTFPPPRWLGGEARANDYLGTDAIPNRGHAWLLGPLVHRNA